MAQQQYNHNAGGGCCTVFRAKVLIGLLALGFGLYIIGPPLYWHAVEESAGADAGSGSGSGTAGIYSASCPVCDCDCESENLAAIALAGLGNLTLGPAECGSEDQDWHSDMLSSKKELREELQLQEAVAADAKQRAESAFLDAKKLASQYQKEAEKCNIGMETSEEARERAEAALEAEKKKSAMWRQRAKGLGWTEKLGSGTGVRVGVQAETQVAELDDPADMQLKVIQLEEVKEEVRDPELNVQVTGEENLGSTSGGSSSIRYKKKKYGKRKKRSSSPSL